MKSYCVSAFLKEKNEFILFISNILSKLYKLIFLCSDTDLFGVVNTGLPVRHWMGVSKVVVVALILVVSAVSRLLLLTST